MRRIVRTVIVAFAIVLAGSPAPAQSRKVLGWLSVGGGVGLAVAAFDYGGVGRRPGEFCPRGHFTYDPAQWRSGCFDAGLERPGLLLAGIGTMGMGAALLILPDTGVTPDLDVQVLNWVETSFGARGGGHGTFDISAFYMDAGAGGDAPQRRRARSKRSPPTGFICSPVAFSDTISRCEDHRPS